MFRERDMLRLNAICFTSTRGLKLILKLPGTNLLALGSMRKLNQDRKYGDWGHVYVKFKEKIIVELFISNLNYFLNSTASNKHLIIYLYMDLFLMP